MGWGRHWMCALILLQFRLNQTHQPHLERDRDFCCLKRGALGGIKHQIPKHPPPSRLGQRPLMDQSAGFDSKKENVALKPPRPLLLLGLTQICTSPPPAFPPDTPFLPLEHNPK